MAIKKAFALLGITCTLSGALVARELRVGPGEEYSTPSAALNDALTGDTITIAEGTWKGDVCYVSGNGRSNITIRGAGIDKTVLDANGACSGGKGIWPFGIPGCTIEGITFTGATCPDKNGAGIRYEADGDLTIRKCRFTRNENGILCGALANATITIEDCKFDYNGYGDGYSHNMYIGKIKQLVVRGTASDHALGGHDLKSRALSTIVEDCVFDDGYDGQASYLLNCPNGGYVKVTGCTFVYAPTAGNRIMISIGEEGVHSEVQSVFEQGRNTFVDHLGATQVKLVNTVQIDEQLPVVIAEEVTGGAWTYGSYDPDAWTPCGSNLLAAATCSSRPATWPGDNVVTLANDFAATTDGAVPGADDATLNYNGVFAIAGGRAIWDLPAPADLHKLRISTRWRDGGRDGIDVSAVYAKRLGVDGLVSLDSSSVQYGTYKIDNHNNSSGHLMATFAREDGSVLVPGMTQLIIEFGYNQDNSGAGYVEIEAVSASKQEEVDPIDPTDPADPIVADSPTVVMSATNIIDGVAASFTLSFGDHAHSTNMLFLCYGAQQGGEGTNGWDRVVRVGAVLPSVDAMTLPVPNGWGRSVLAVQGVLMDGLALSVDSRIDYVASSDGKPWIDLGFTAGPATVSQLTFRYLQYGGNYFYGLQPGDDAKDYRFFLAKPGGTIDTYLDLPSGNSSGGRFLRNNFTYGLNEVCSCEIGNFYLCDLSSGVNVITGKDFNFDRTDYCLRLFCSTDYGEVYDLKVFESREFVHWFLPAVKDGKAGLVDAQTGEFHGNSGEGELVVGGTPVAVTPSSVASATDVLTTEPIEEEDVEIVNADIAADTVPGLWQFLADTGEYVHKVDVMAAKVGIAAGERCLVPGTMMAYTRSAWAQGGAGGSWTGRDYVSYVYVGYMHFDQGRYDFISSMDDTAYIEIDGAVIHDCSTYTAGFTSHWDCQQAGWYPVCLAVGDKTSEAGPISGQDDKAFHFSTDEGRTWRQFVDPGDGSLLRAAKPSEAEMAAFLPRTEAEMAGSVAGLWQVKKVHGGDFWNVDVEGTPCGTGEFDRTRQLGVMGAFYMYKGGANEGMWENSFAPGTYSQWTQNVSFAYSGYMYLPKGKVRFYTDIDDGSKIVINGLELEGTATDAYSKDRAYVSEAAGWYQVRFILVDAGGWAGGKNGARSFLYSTDDGANWRQMLDSGDGTLFRIFPEPEEEVVWPDCWTADAPAAAKAAYAAWKAEKGPAAGEPTAAMERAFLFNRPAADEIRFWISSVTVDGGVMTVGVCASVGNEAVDPSTFMSETVVRIECSEDLSDWQTVETVATPDLTTSTEIVFTARVGRFVRAVAGYD